MCPTSKQQLRGFEVRVSAVGVFDMVDRQSLGDIGFAVLLGLTLLALARPQPIHHRTVAAPPAIQLASADRVPARDRIGLFG